MICPQCSSSVKTSIVRNNSSLVRVIKCVCGYRSATLMEDSVALNKMEFLDKSNNMENEINGSASR